MIRCSEYKKCPEFEEEDVGECPHKQPHNYDLDDEDCVNIQCQSEWAKQQPRNIFCVDEFVLQMEEALNGVL